MPKKYELLVEPNEGKKYTISIWDNLENYEDYEKLLESMSKISKKDTVKLYVSTPGGRCDIGFMLIDRIRELECMVDVVAPYPTYSMGAIMALCGNSLEISPGSYLMFHDYSGGGGRQKGNETLKSTEAYCEVFNYRFNSICQPFLTKKECEDVLQGKDLYIKWNDPSLKDRIKRHF
jgi:ATP-dependent protease ClpP protease subunit